MFRHFNLIACRRLKRIQTTDWRKI